MSAVSDASAEYGAPGSRVRVTSHLATPEPVAGGPCWIRVTVAAQDGPTYIVVGTDRRTGRPAHVAIDGAVGPQAIADPFAGPRLGDGPGGPLAVLPGSPYETTLIVNEFLRLEALRDLIEPGERAALRLTVHPGLHPAREAAAALTELAGSAGSAAALEATELEAAALEAAALELVAVVHRDDGALQAEIDALAARLRGWTQVATSNELEEALRTLVALRLPAARVALADLAGHPNPQVRAAAAAAAP